MKNRLLNIWTALVVVFCSLLILTTCENSDQFDTDILSSKETTVKAYGPNPALRGQSLSFAGTHLDKITKVILPNNIEITNIEVVSEKLIKVIVPQETVEGLVKLIGPNNLELNPRDSLHISEPISITQMTPQPVKAGQVLTIEGDYFNFMTKVVFTDKVEVLAEDCKSWTRTKIEVVVPAEAAPGVVLLLNDDEIPLEYQSPDPLQVVLPSVNAVLDLTDNKPGDVITAPGKDLDLVIRVEMPNGNEVPFSVEGDALIFTLAENVSDGAIVMIPASEVKVVVANIGVAAPAEIVVTPDKGLRADSEITITGINMELVTSIKFPGVNAVDKKDFVSQSTTEIVVKMPAMAISGEIILNTASGKTVEAEIETLKPDVDAYNPSPVSAGTDVKLQGHNLDLVATVTFADNLVLEVTPSVANELLVPVPLNAVSGVVVLTMANGETVECDELEITEPEFAYLLNPPGPKVDIIAGQILAVEIGNGEKLTDVQINGVSVNFIVYAPNAYISIPNNAKGNTELKLISSNGEAVYTILITPSGIIETVVWEGIAEFSNWNNVSIPNANFGNAKVGDRLRFYLFNLGDEPILQVFYGDWDGQLIPEDFKFPGDTKYFDITLTAEMIQHILNPAWGSAALVIQGQDVSISKISILSGNEPEITVLWQGSLGPTNWNGDLLAPLDANLLVPGKIMGIDFEVDPGGGQMEVMSGSWWAALPGWEALNGGERYLMDCAASDTNVEFTISQEDIDNIKMQGSALLFAGNGGVTIKRIYLK